MQLSPETMMLLAGLEVSQEVKLELFRALERDWQAYSQPATSSGANEERERVRNGSTYAERKRAKDRQRRADERAELRRLKAEREATATTPATPGEATATEGDKPPTTGDHPTSPSCTRKLPLSSSLRSEGIPPENPSGSTPRGSEKRGSRLPDDWRPDAEGWAYAVTELGSEPVAQGQLDRFRDYWRGVPGAKGRKLDWPGTWRNWVRRAVENQPRKAHERPHPHPDRKQVAFVERLGDIDAAMAAAFERDQR